MKTFTWRSTYKESLSDAVAHSSLTKREINVLNMLWYSYSIRTSLLNSSFFELIRLGDGKYTLIVQKYTDDSYSIKFQINEQYANNAERYA